MAAELSYTDDDTEQEERVRLRILPDMMPTPEGFVRWFDGSLYRQGWRDEDIQPSPSCSDRCYPMRYLTPGNSETLFAVLLHDPTVHENHPLALERLEIERQQLAERMQREEELRKPSKLITDHLVVDFDRRDIIVDGTSIDPTASEYKILAILAMSYASFVTYEDLVAPIWGISAMEEPLYEGHGKKYEASGVRKLRMALNRLRPKLGEDINRFIRTKMGEGLILEDVGSEVVYVQRDHSRP